MATAATVKVVVRFSTSASFGPPLVLNDVSTPLDTGVLADSTVTILDLTSNVQQISINRGRSRVLDTFEGGTATIECIDTTGVLDPDNGTHANEIKPMIQVVITATHGGTERFLFSGYIEAWNYTYQQDIDASFVTIAAVDGERILNLANVSTVAGQAAGQDTGTRINKILNTISWPSSERSIDTGDTTCQADPGTLRPALSAIRTCATTEIGGFFMDVDGKTKFVSRENTIKALTTTPTQFNDTGTQIPYVSLDFNTDDTVLANKISVTRTGGTTQVASDAASISTYFERDLVRNNLLMETDAVALDYANAVLATRKDADLRIKGITIDSTADVTATVNAALDTDFFQPIQVTRAQPGGGTISRNLTVQGIRHNITTTRFLTTFNTAEPLVTGFILNDAQYGVLDTSALGY
tara:strand:+ start:2321 stop:3556 length:1236 start_codon:yes stop_codon:yes gene_type:complete